MTREDRRALVELVRDTANNPFGWIVLALVFSLLLSFVGAAVSIAFPDTGWSICLLAGRIAAVSLIAAPVLILFVLFIGATGR